MRTSIEDIVRTKSAPVVNALGQVPDVKAILCFGSYAVGTFDQDSDIDLYVFCHPDIVPSSLRRNVLQRTEGIQDLEMHHVELGWDNQWCPQGDRCRLEKLPPFDISYNTVNWLRTVTDAVKNHGATSIPELRFRPYTMLGLLDNSVILYDPESILQTMKSSLYPYPVTLQQTLLSENLAIARGSLADLHDYVKRNIGNSAFHFHLSRILDCLCTIMFAVNRRYDPATKRTEEAFRILEIAPDCFLERYTRILEVPLTSDGRERIVSALGKLLGEIEDLCGRAQNNSE